MITRLLLLSLFSGTSMLGFAGFFKPDVCQLRLRNVNGIIFVSCSNPTCHNCNIGFPEDNSLVWCACNGQILLDNNCYADIQPVEPWTITCLTLQCVEPAGCQENLLPAPGMAGPACDC